MTNLNDFLSSLKGQLGIGGIRLLRSEPDAMPLALPLSFKDDPTDGSVENPQTAAEKWMADQEAFFKDNPDYAPEPALEPVRKPAENNGTYTLGFGGLMLQKPE